MKKYYFENSIIEEKYPTLWHGYLEYNGNKINITEDYHQNSNRELDDLLADICDVNFYVSLIDNKIHLSLCRDSNYYIDNFEKNIKDIVQSIEKKFNIKIISGEIYANEVKHNGKHVKYNLSKKNKIILKRNILSFKDEIIEDNLKKMKI
jgi:hypothetical protein